MHQIIKVKQEYIDKIEKLYDKFIEENINIMLHFTTPMWLHPKEIGFNWDTIWAYEDLRSKDKKLVCNDPFVKSEYAGNFDLGKDILERGTFWHFVIITRNGKYFIKEGKHRMSSIHLLLEKGLWPKDKKVFCLVCDEGKSVFDKKQRFRKSHNVMRFRWYGEELDKLHHLTDYFLTDRPKRAMRIIGGSCGSFRNFFWQTKMSIKPSEKFNNYEKYKNYWVKK